MDRLKMWLHNFWWNFRQDPFGYIFEFILCVLVIALIALQEVAKKVAERYDTGPSLFTNEELEMLFGSY